MLKLIILLLKIFSAIIVSVAGILGIVGKSTNEKGQLTEYGKASLLTLIIALLVGLIISVIEYFIERKTEKDEEMRIRDDLKMQRNILKDIQRSIYSIDSIDFLITVKVDFRKDKSLRKYRKELERFITRYLEDPKQVFEEFPSDTTHVIPNRDENPSHPIFCITLTKDSPLHPLKDINAKAELSPSYSVLITDHIEFSTLDNMLEEFPYPGQFLYRLCDMEFYIPADLENDSTDITYYPGENHMFISTLINDAEISHDNGKIASALDLEGKYLIIFSNYFSRFKDSCKLGEWRVQFNKSENKHYNSIITISPSDSTYLEGKGWAAYAYKISLEPSKVPVIKI